MKFVNTEYFAYAIVAIIIIGLIFNRLNARFFKWIKAYWFFDRTWTNKISTFFYTLSLFLMMSALLDLRGPEKKIRASIPDQKTIILIDSSASMLSEDVRPNRFIKSLQVARHFVKNAPGHQISIVLFSDIQKRLLPFTDDVDLIDSRLAALEHNNTVAGGSNISQAVEESIQYFEFDSRDDEKSKTGNMLVFTDAEESEGAFKVNMPTNVNLAIIGVGTAKGGNIPIRWEDGSFKGYKEFKGTPVVTKLDENYVKQIGKDIKSFKYWIINSYSLPTDEIVNFFRSAFKNKQGTGDLRIRPVFSHYILIPAIVLYCISVLLGRFAIFKSPKSLVLVFLLLVGAGARAEDVQTPEIKKDLEVIQKGKANREYILKTAEKILRTKDTEKATKLYSEYAKETDSEEVRFNQATSLLKSNRIKEALPMVQGLLKNSKNEELKDKLRKNIRISIDQQKKKNEEEQKKKEDEKNNKDNKKDDKKENQDKKDEKQPNQQGSDKEKNKEEQQGKDGSKEDRKNEKGKEGKEDKDKNKDEGKDKKEGRENEEEIKSTGPSTLEEKEKEIEQKRRMTKTPAMIKQIMSDDRDLQRKMMDTSTNVRGEQRPKRDW